MAIRKNSPSKGGPVNKKSLEPKLDPARREAARKFGHEFGKKHSRAMKKLAE